MINISFLKTCFLVAAFALVLSLDITAGCVVAQTTPNLNKQASSIRAATFNVALNRRNDGDLLKELKLGTSDKACKVAAIIQMVRPDVLLLNEVDFDGGKTVEAFETNFLGKPQFGQKPIQYTYRYVATVNTGVRSKLDLNNDGKKDTADDAFGFGSFPGQYGMAVLSMHPIAEDYVRTFQKFRWKDMPDALLPTDPKTNKPWYSREAMDVFRLSSKSHWDLPISVDGKQFHFLTCHPTPPVFDKEEDRNGKRNHDEIRLWADYIDNECPWLYDDNGVKGGLPRGANFVIAGDLNADPNDGDSTDNAIQQLLDHEKILASPIPESTGGTYFSKLEGKANLKQKGDPSHDTANFNDQSVGNVRIDYVLPSKGIKVTNQGVFWPKPGEPGADLADASDHRLVWIDIELP